MADDFEDKDHTEFLRVDRMEMLEEDDDGEGLVLSRAAFQLHSFSIVESVNDGHPGFVSDDYLSAISAETDLTATELRLAGLWERVDGGYTIHDDMVEMAVRITARMAMDERFNPPSEPGDLPN